MFFSHDCIKAAYAGLIKLDDSDGKSRKEKVSGLRYLLAASKLMRERGADTLDLSVGSDERANFLDAVGWVVKLNDKGLYSKDWASEVDERKDYAVGNNFLTTKVASSRSVDSNYPHRPASLLALSDEILTILDDIAEPLAGAYGLSNIKPEICVWLLRDIELEITNDAPVATVFEVVRQAINNMLTSEVASAVLPTEEKFSEFLGSFEGGWFSSEPCDYSDVAVVVADEAHIDEVDLGPHVLTNSLPDDDEIYCIVQNLLIRGAKGILFTGPPGTSKTWYALKVALKVIEGNEDRLERIQFHPSFTYEDFIEGLVSTGSATGSTPMFLPKDKVFLKLCEKARCDKDNVYILVIDEFSRGDPSKMVRPRIPRHFSALKNTVDRLRLAQRDHCKYAAV